MTNYMIRIGHKAHEVLRIIIFNTAAVLSKI